MNTIRKALLGAAALIATSMVAETPAVAQQQPAQQKPNILFIMGDDIGIMQPSIYHRGLMVGRDAEHRSHRQRRCAVHALLCRAELHGRAATPSSPACIRCAPA